MATLPLRDEQQVHAANVSIELLRQFSHNMRSPLNALMGTADMFDGGIYGELNAKQRRAIQRQQRNSHRMLALLDDMMIYIRANAGELPLATSPFNPVELLRAVCATVENTGGGILQVEVAESVPDTLIGDPQQIKKILLALVWNAQAVAEEGEVRMVADWSADSQWQVEVHDTGPGIASDDCESIFEPFWHDATRSGPTPSSGFGLGLAVARTLARHMAGDVELKETGATGSIFCLALPLMVGTNKVSVSARETTSEQV